GGDPARAADLTGAVGLAAGRAQIQPDGRAFRIDDGNQEACLAAPEDVLVGLELQRLTGAAFRTVASADTSDGVARLNADTPAGVYRYRVVGLDGVGAYTLAFSAG
ncbi:serine protease, partial [Micromonospora globispora]